MIGSQKPIFSSRSSLRESREAWLHLDGFGFSPGKVFQNSDI
jgi:hypothetical protein